MFPHRDEPALHQKTGLLKKHHAEVDWSRRVFYPPELKPINDIQDFHFLQKKSLQLTLHPLTYKPQDGMLAMIKVRYNIHL